MRPHAPVSAPSIQGTIAPSAKHARCMGTTSQRCFSWLYVALTIAQLACCPSAAIMVGSPVASTDPAIDSEQPILDIVATALHESDEGTNRLARSPLFPPTVTSLQPHRKGVSSRMHDPTLQTGRQSEGPSHPQLMRRAPARTTSSDLLSSPVDVARPRTMFFQPPNETLTPSYSSQNNFYIQQPPSPPPSRDLVVATDEEMAQRSSRQRRVENSSSVQQTSQHELEKSSDDSSQVEIEAIRHGRFDDFLGERDRNSNRFDTFGHEISELVWSGPRRSASPMHPAARAHPARNRQSESAPEDNSIWSRKSGHRFSRPKFSHPFLTSSESDISANTVVEEQATVSGGSLRGNRFTHPGSRMSGWSGLSSVDSANRRNDDRIVISEPGARSGGSHPRMLRPSVSRSSQNTVNNQNIVSIDDIIKATNQTYEQFSRNLEMKSLTLTALYVLTTNGASLEDILNLLHIPESRTTTVVTPVMRTIDPIMWELNNANERERQRLETLDGEADGKSSTTYSNPVYGRGVHPMHDDAYEASQITTESSYTEIDMSVYDGDYSNESYSYYSEESLNESPVSNGQARIHSFTIQEIPIEDFNQDSLDPVNKDHGSSGSRSQDASDNVSHNNHPHYFAQDQLAPYVDPSHDNNYASVDDSFSTKSQLPQSSSNILLQDEHHDGWRSLTPGEELNHRDHIKSRPVTYAIIAASAIMASLAAFALFVLLAYTIVKCTKKPTLNNYQVSDKMPVEVAAA